MENRHSSIFDRSFLIVTLVVVAVIYYGSFYPFAWRVPPHGIGPVQTLISSWAEKPGRGDFLANILLYCPLGFFGFHAMRREIGWPIRAGIIVMLGALISISVELTQYYDEGRVTAATDVYANVLGTITGLTMSGLLGSGIIRPLFDEKIGDRAALMLVACWGAYRLYPYVPTIDLHKYWHAIRPLLVEPTLAPYDLYRHTAIWLTIALLIEAVVGNRRSRFLFPLFAVGVLFAKVLIDTAILSTAEVAGAIVATLLWLPLASRPRLSAIVAALLFIPYVVASRLEPFHLENAARAFGWIPFRSFMSGSINVDAQAFLEKLFLYGGAIWILVKLGWNNLLATLVVAVAMFLTSWTERYLPGRSAEITDTLMALMAGLFVYLVDLNRKEDDSRASLAQADFGRRRRA